MPRFLVLDGLSNFGTQWTKLMTDVYSVIVTITVPTAIVFAAICLLIMQFNKDQKAVEGAKTWLKRIVITAAAILLLGFIATTLVSWLRTIDSGIGTMPSKHV